MAIHARRNALLFFTSLSLSLSACMPSLARAEIVIVHSNDVLGEIEPCGCRSNPLGGMARKANLLAGIEKKDAVIQLDAGDLLFPSDSLPPMLEKQSERQAEYLLKAMDQLHHDAGVPGEKDFALGWKTFEKLRAHTKVKFLAANLSLAKGGKAFEPYAIFKRKDDQGKTVRVAVIGLVGDDLQWPKALKVSPPIEAAKKQIAALRGKADFIVALTHEGLDADKELATAVPGIDIIIGGHTQSFLQQSLKVNGAQIYQSSFRNQYIGIIPLTHPIDFKDYQLIGLDPAYDSPEGKPGTMDLLVKKFKTDVAKLNLDDSAATEAQLEKSGLNKAPKFQTWPRCAECHLEQYDFWRKTPHARALDPLVRADQSANKECLSCHTVGLGDPSGLIDIAKLAEVRDEKGVHTLPVPQLNLFLKAMAEAKDLETPISLTPEDKPVPLQQVLNRLDHAWTPVQCENCHTGAQDHPFTPGLSKQVAVTRCVQCHTPERAPAWYLKDGKLNEAFATEKIKAMSCPANKDSGPSPAPVPSSAGP
jgi:hypothetical protein